MGARDLVDMFRWGSWASVCGDFIFVDKWVHSEIVCFLSGSWYFSPGAALVLPVTGWEGRRRSLTFFCLFFSRVQLNSFTKILVFNYCEFFKNWPWNANYDQGFDHWFQHFAPRRRGCGHWNQKKVCNNGHNPQRWDCDPCKDPSDLWKAYRCSRREDWEPWREAYAPCGPSGGEPWRDSCGSRAPSDWTEGHAPRKEGWSPWEGDHPLWKDDSHPWWAGWDSGEDTLTSEVDPEPWWVTLVFRQAEKWMLPSGSVISPPWITPIAFDNPFVPTDGLILWTTW